MAGNADSAAALTVKLPAIKIVKGLEDNEVEKGANVNLEIETNETPQTIQWFKNGKEIEPIDKIQPKKISDTKYQLKISDCDENDTANFKVLSFKLIKIRKFEKL